MTVFQVLLDVIFYFACWVGPFCCIQGVGTPLRLIRMGIHISTIIVFAVVFAFACFIGISTEVLSGGLPYLGVKWSLLSMGGGVVWSIFWSWMRWDVLFEPIYGGIDWRKLIPGSKGRNRRARR